jgi:hypothetical protein
VSSDVTDADYEKVECVSSDVTDADYDIAAYMHQYNYRRGHNCNDYLAPAMAEVM